MSEPAATERALAEIVAALARLGKAHALVGGLAVSARAEVRFTRDVDVAVTVADDAEAERLVHSLRQAHYQPLASVEHEARHRLSTARLLSPMGVKTDLLFASCGIEPEVVARATRIEVPGAGPIAVARAEELLAMKVLSMSDRRLQDRIDAQKLIAFVADLDLSVVRANLSLITTRGYHREQDLEKKLSGLLAEAALNR